MSKSEMLLVMISGLGTLSGALFAVYGSIGVSARHLIASGVISIPASIAISKILIPEEKDFDYKNNLEETKKSQDRYSNSIDALMGGTMEGLTIAGSIFATLIVFVSLISIVNNIMISSTSTIIGKAYSLDILLGYLFSPISFFLGIPSNDNLAVGNLLGQKLVINEFVAYSNFVKINLTERASIISTYALAGFSNFSSIGTILVCISYLAPNQKQNLISLGSRALLGGTLVNLLNAAVVGILI
jgi:CNT family concentrative nucleoside transporter